MGGECADYLLPKLEKFKVLSFRIHHTGKFLQNILSCFFGTTQNSETNDTSFESLNKELLKLVGNVGCEVSYRLPHLHK